MLCCSIAARASSPVLTAAGRELLAEGRMLLRAAGDLEHRIRRIATGWEPELRIAVDTIVPFAAILPLIDQLRPVLHGKSSDPHATASDQRGSWRPMGRAGRRARRHGHRGAGRGTNGSSRTHAAAGRGRNGVRRIPATSVGIGNRTDCGCDVATTSHRCHCRHVSRESATHYRTHRRTGHAHRARHAGQVGGTDRRTRLRLAAAIPGVAASRDASASDQTRRRAARRRSRSYRVDHRPTRQGACMVAQGAR